MPDTTTDFINVLRAFSDRDPNGNDLRDEIDQGLILNHHPFEWDLFFS